MSIDFPQKIYMSHKTLTHIREFSKNWKRLNPEYDIELYDDSRCEHFLLEQFSTKHRDCFRFIKDGPIKADFWRVCILYKYGGVYVDADIEPMVPIRDFLESGVDFLTCINHHGSTFNPHIIIAKAGDDTLKKCIDRYVEIFSSYSSSYSYWGWSITKIFTEYLILRNFKGVDGIYQSETAPRKTVQIIREHTGKSDKLEDFQCSYKGRLLLNNRYSQYNPHDHCFKEVTYASTSTPFVPQSNRFIQRPNNKQGVEKFRTAKRLRFQ